MTGITKTDNENLLDAITKYHDDLESLQIDFHEKIVMLESFYAEPTTDESKFVFQYDPKNQKVWTDCISVINGVLSAIDIILLEKYQRMKRMDMFDMNRSPEVVDVNQPELPKEDKKMSLFDRLTRKRNPVKTTTSVFEMEKNDIEQVKKIKDDWYAHVDYHVRALSLQEDFDKYTMRIHLIPERTDFRNRVAKIETTFEHFLQMKLSEVSFNAKDILTAVTKMQHMERNDFMANMGNNQN